VASVVVKVILRSAGRLAFTSQVLAAGVGTVEFIFVSDFRRWPTVVKGRAERHKATVRICSGFIFICAANLVSIRTSGSN
jgi:hypothetical protein